MGRKYPSHQTRGLREHREVSQRGPGQSFGRKRFYYNLISADRLRWQQKQQILHFSFWKVKGTVPQFKKWGTGTPYAPVKSCLWLTKCTLIALEKRRTLYIHSRLNTHLSSKPFHHTLVMIIIMMIMIMIMLMIKICSSVVAARSNVLHFVTLWSWTLTFSSLNRFGDYPCDVLHTC